MSERDDDYEDEMSPEEQEALEDEMNCSQMPDGSCMAAGSEYCEFECPYRRMAR